MSEPIGVGELSELFSEESPVIACELNSGCWLWCGSATLGGYGKIKIGGRRGREFYAHRLSFEAHFRPLRRGEVVCHRCDTPRCVNPSHLFAGDQAANMRDAYQKGRLNDPNRDRTTPEDEIAEIKRRLISGESGREVARAFGISEATVSAIKNGRRWGHVRPSESLFLTRLMDVPADPEQVTA